MARVVLIADSDSGALVDVAGYSRETGRYSKFARRMMSTHTNPQLDYGVNGGDTLTISKNGNAGKAINLIAEIVNVSQGLKVNGKTIEEISEEGKEAVLGRVVGTDGEIDVKTVLDDETGKTQRKVSLDPAVSTKIEQISGLIDQFEETIGRMSESIEQLGTAVENIGNSIESLSSRIDIIEFHELEYVTRREVASVADGIYIGDEDTLEDVKEKMNILLFRIASIAGGGSSDLQEVEP